MSGLLSLLSQQLAEAQAQGDFPRQIALASALLKERGSDANHLLTVIAQGCRELVIANDPADLGAVLAWYQTWFRYTRDPAVRPFLDMTQQRINVLRQAEDNLSRAMQERDVVILRNCIEEMSAMSDRLATTAALLQQANAILDEQIAINKRKITERYSRIEQLKAFIQGAIPFAMDNAAEAFAELLQLDPSADRDPIFQHMNERIAVLKRLHRDLEQSMAQKAIKPLRDAITAAQQHPERMSTTNQLIAQAEQLHRERSEQQTMLLKELAAMDRRRPDLLVPLIEKILVLDPDHVLRSELELQQRAWKNVRDWHAVIADAPHLHLRDIAQAVHQLEHSFAGLADTPAVIAEGREYVQRRRERQRRTWLRFGIIATTVGGLLLASGLVWLRDKRDFTALHGISDPVQGHQLANNYLNEFHVFYHDDVQRFARRFGEQKIIQELEQLARLKPLSQRLTILEQRLQQPNLEQRDRYAGLHEQTVLALDDETFAAAQTIDDATQRLAALNAYAQRAEPTRAAKAQRAIALTQQQRDDKMWLAIFDAPNEQGKLQLIDQYLALPQPRRASEAQTMRDAIEKSEKQREERAADDARWEAAFNVSDPDAGIIALEEYLSKPGRHASEAQKRLPQLLRASDELAWKNTSAPCDPATSKERALAYLQRRGPRAFDKLAGQQLAQATWDLARLVENDEQRFMAVKGYLSDPVNQVFRADAERMHKALQQQLTSQRLTVLTEIEDPLARAQALWEFIEQESNSDQILLAEENLALAAQQLLSEQPDFVIALPEAIIRRIPLSDLTKLAPEIRARIPLRVQMLMPLKPSWAQAAGVDKYGRWADVPLGASSVRLRYIPAGQLQINEQVTLTVTAPFWLAETELSQDKWVYYQRGLFSNGNPSKHLADDVPVHNTSREQCDGFIAAVQRDWQEKKIAARVRLPSKTEWQYVAYSALEGSEAIIRGTAPKYQARDYVRMVYAAAPNAGPSTITSVRRDQWGLSDVLGNVSEWVSDTLSEPSRAIWMGGNWTMKREASTPEASGYEAVNKAVMGAGLRLVVE
jgi:Sulfatase-modifying factor enzyme 1